MQFDVTFAAFEWKLIWNLTEMKYHEIATERPGTSKNAMPSILFMWLIRRQLQNLWATRKLEMQVEIGGMGRKNQRNHMEIFHAPLWI